MQRELSITAEPEHLDEGSPEERACFAAIAIRFGEFCLTEGHDGFVKKVRTAPLLSGYHLAEWVAWNWWRLRWEPRSAAPDWDFAHRMPTIGEGYVWPNVTVFSDGARVALIAKPTRDRSNTAFRYLTDLAFTVSAHEFEYAVDKFVEQVRGLLRGEGLDRTNLDRIWRELQEERDDLEISRWRKLEALLGCDPDEADTRIVAQLLADGKTLGQPAMDEVAADHPQGGDLLTAESLHELAVTAGFDASPRDMVRLEPNTSLVPAGEVPAWLLGAEAARAVREQQQLGAGPISNDRLAKMAGVGSVALTERGAAPSISFALDKRATKSRVVLRSKWKAGRRFELARLLGDRIVSASAGRLFPATRAYTYRQKVQRSFAAELLSPFSSVEAMLAGDYSQERQQDVAEYFDVSELTIRTSLVNHRRIAREDLEEDLDVVA